MSNQPVAPQAGGEPPSRARGANAAPSQPGTGRNRNASVQRERQAVPGVLRDGAATSAAMAAHGEHVGRVLYLQPQFEVRQGTGHHEAEQPPGHFGARDAPQSTAGRPRPSYVPRPQKGREQPYAAPRRLAIEQPEIHGPYPYEGVQEERQGTPPQERALPRGGSYAVPGGALPPGSSRPRPGGALLGRSSLKTAKTIERVSTLTTAPPSGSPPPPHAHDAHQQYPQTMPSSGKKMEEGQPSSKFLQQGKKKKQTETVAFCFTACCILFWFLVVCIGLAILVVYLLYRPHPPRLRVTTATLNAGYIDQLPPPNVGLALNSDLYVLAAIYNPNTKIDVVLHYMQLDLYFEGRLIGTQAVWPAPLHERPGDSALRNVHLVVSEVTMTREDVAVWENSTTKGGLVQMQLVGRFHVQLNFGRWLPFRYWVYPSCSLWLEPPPGGALRRARCRQ
ncbi:uncharacterized protein LOC133908291 [Phragmites australis]|uniref:uncharacterized protein LOC133908291 n=1 Tax=Phragmites australis TaxID=29695 RepID=UPI002D77AE3B|nr:uncharacterized protein LOC133908291 [Phragmites australis]